MSRFKTFLFVTKNRLSNFNMFGNYVSASDQNGRYLVAAKKSVHKDRIVLKHIYISPYESGKSVTQLCESICNRHLDRPLYAVTKHLSTHSINVLYAGGFTNSETCKMLVFDNSPKKLFKEFMQSYTKYTKDVYLDRLHNIVVTMLHNKRFIQCNNFLKLIGTLHFIEDIFIELLCVTKDYRHWLPYREKLYADTKTYLSEDNNEYEVAEKLENLK